MFKKKSVVAQTCYPSTRGMREGAQTLLFVGLYIVDSLSGEHLKKKTQGSSLVSPCPLWVC